VPSHLLVIIVEQAHQFAYTGARIVARGIMCKDAGGTAPPRCPSHDRLLGHFPCYLNILPVEYVDRKGRDTRKLGAALLIPLVGLFHERADVWRQAPEVSVQAIIEELLSTVGAEERGMAVE